MFTKCAVRRWAEGVGEGSGDTNRDQKVSRTLFALLAYAKKMIVGILKKPVAVMNVNYFWTHVESKEH